MNDQALLSELEKRLRELQNLRKSVEAIKVTPEMEEARIKPRIRDAYLSAIKAMMWIVDEIAED